MGKKSRAKKERKEFNGENANKMMNDIRKKSRPIVVEKVVKGKTVRQYYNPTKKMMQMKGYTDQGGNEALDTMVRRYAKYFEQNNINLENENKEGEE